MITHFKGHLEIDHNRGVVYFHSVNGVTILRICNLPKPIPTWSVLACNPNRALAGASWSTGRSDVSPGRSAPVSYVGTVNRCMGS